MKALLRERLLLLYDKFSEIITAVVPSSPFQIHQFSHTSYKPGFALLGKTIATRLRLTAFDVHSLHVTNGLRPRQ
jgi:hypothetical protein